MLLSVAGCFGGAVSCAEELIARSKTDHNMQFFIAISFTSRLEAVSDIAIRAAIPKVENILHNAQLVKNRDYTQNPPGE
jgi:hypothetical protein